MEIDQDFVKENIQDFMRVFERIHKGHLTKANRSYHKKGMLTDCDTITYRPIYHIVQTVPQKINLRDEREYKKEINRLETILTWRHKECINKNIMIDQLIENKF
jgi:hypothetical protein